jgi:hypothetical protein
MVTFSTGNPISMKRATIRLVKYAASCREEPYTCT